MPVKIKRVYEPPAAEDGYRVLVDRVWPRGVSRERAAVDEWLKEIAPSTELRRWFGHQAERWPEFRSRYQQELRERRDLVAALRQRAAGTLTLLYAAKDQEQNNAVVLAEILKSEEG